MKYKSIYCSVTQFDHISQKDPECGLLCSTSACSNQLSSGKTTKCVAHKLTFQYHQRMTFLYKNFGVPGLNFRLEFFLFQQRQRLAPVRKIKNANQPKNVGEDMDSVDLNLSSHIKESKESAYYHLKNTWRTDRFMSHQDMEKLVHVFTFSQLHHCSGVFTVLSAKIMNKQLQMSQNAAAQLLTQTRKLDFCPQVPCLSKNCIKILPLVAKALHQLGPKSISDMLFDYGPSIPFRLSFLFSVETKHGSIFWLQHLLVLLNAT